jgi:putative membrane protein
LLTKKCFSLFLGLQAVHFESNNFLEMGFGIRLYFVNNRYITHTKTLNQEGRGAMTLFMLTWAITSLSLWAASYVFDGLQFNDSGALIISALVLGLANAIVRPLLILFTLPLTLLSMGLFLLVINALVLMLVAELVSGFVLAGFWTAFFASIFIAILNAFIGSFFAINRIKIERI